MFVSLDEAICKMEESLSPVGRDLAAWPVAPGASEQEIRQVEHRLGRQLPLSFRETISAFDFLNAVAGNVSMVQASNLYDWLVAPNVEPVEAPMVRWWPGEARPDDLILIAQSDAHTILLDLDSGEIRAIWIDESDATARMIAESFSLFYQGIASVYLAGLGSAAAEKMATVVASSVGADPKFPFWERFAVGAG